MRRLFIYAQSVLMILSGAFGVADVKVGWLMMSVSMVVLIATRDNPWLELSDFGRR